MKHTALFCALIATAAFAAPAHAIFKCTTAKGVVYQDRPCREGNEADVTIVIPTGELAPKATPAVDDPSAVTPRADGRPTNAAPGRAPSDNAVSTRKGGETRTTDAAAAAEASRRRDSKPSAEGAAVPMSADQARRTEPSAKYYATEAFGPGNETPMQMNCESPTGERRVFYLSNGKLTSI